MTSTHLTTLGVIATSTLQAPQFLTSASAAEQQAMVGIHAIKIAEVSHLENGQTYPIKPTSGLRVEVMDSHNIPHKIYELPKIASVDNEKFTLNADGSMQLFLTQAEIQDKSSIYIVYNGEYTKGTGQEAETVKTTVSSRVEMSINGNELSINDESATGAMIPTDNAAITISDGSRDSVKVMSIDGVQSGEQLVEIGVILRQSTASQGFRTDAEYTADGRATLKQAMLTARLDSDNGRINVMVGSNADLERAFGTQEADETTTLGEGETAVEYQLIRIEEQYGNDCSVANTRDLEGTKHAGAKIFVRASGSAVLFSNNYALSGADASTTTSHPTDKPEIVPISVATGLIATQISADEVCLEFDKTVLGDDASDQDKAANQTKTLAWRQIKMNSELFNATTVYHVEVVRKIIVNGDEQDHNVLSLRLGADELDGATLSFADATDWAHRDLRLRVTTQSLKSGTVADGTYETLGVSFRDEDFIFRLFDKVMYDSGFEFVQDANDNFEIRNRLMARGMNYQLVTSQVDADGEASNGWQFRDGQEGSADPVIGDTPCFTCPGGGATEYDGESHVMICAQSATATVNGDASTVVPDDGDSHAKYLPMTARAFQDTALVVKMTKLTQLDTADLQKTWAYDNEENTAVLGFSENAANLKNTILVAYLTSRFCKYPAGHEDAGKEIIYDQKTVYVANRDPITGDTFDTTINFENVPKNDAVYAQIKVLDDKVDPDNLDEPGRSTVSTETCDTMVKDLGEETEQTLLVLLQKALKQVPGQPAPDVVPLVTVAQKVATDKKLGTTPSCATVDLANGGVKTFDTAELNKSDIVVLDMNLHAKSAAPGKLTHTISYNGTEPCDELAKLLKFTFKASTVIQEQKDQVTDNTGAEISPAQDELKKEATAIAKEYTETTDGAGNTQLDAPTVTLDKETAEFIEGTSSLLVYSDAQRGDAGSKYATLQFAHQTKFNDQGEAEQDDTLPATTTKHLVLGKAEFSLLKQAEDKVLGELKITVNETDMTGDAARARLFSTAGAVYSLHVSSDGASGRADAARFLANDEDFENVFLAAVADAEFRARLSVTYNGDKCEFANSKALIPYLLDSFTLTPKLDADGHAVSNSYDVHNSTVQSTLTGIDQLTLATATGDNTKNETNNKKYAAEAGSLTLAGTFSEDYKSDGVIVAKITVSSDAVNEKEEVKDGESGEVTQEAHPGYYANEASISKLLLITSAPVANADNLSARSLSVVRTAQGHSVKNTLELTMNGANHGTGTALSIAQSNGETDAMPAWVAEIEGVGNTEEEKAADKAARIASINWPTTNSQSIKFGNTHKGSGDVAYTTQQVDNFAYFDKNADEPNATLTADDLAEWLTDDALLVDQVGPGDIVGVHSVTKVSEMVNDDVGNPLTKGAEETEDEFKRRKGIQWLKNAGYEQINSQLDIVANADHRANSSNAQAFKVGAVNEAQELETTFEGIVYWKATRSQETVVTSQQKFEVCMYNRSTICLQHWYDIKDDNITWGADWKSRYGSLRINGQCTNIETGYVPSQAIPLITGDLECQEDVDKEGNAAVDYKMAAQLPLHPLIGDNAYKLTFGNGGISQGTADANVATMFTSYKLSEAVEGEEQKVTDSEALLKVVDGAATTAGFAQQNAYALMLKATPRIIGTDADGMLVVMDGQKTVMSIKYQTDEDYKQDEHSCPLSNQNPTISITAEDVAAADGLDGSWELEIKAKAVDGFVDSDVAEGNNSFVALIQQGPIVDNKATGGVIRRVQLPATATIDLTVPTSLEKVDEVDAEDAEEKTETVTLKSMISVPGGGSSVQCFEIDIKSTPAKEVDQVKVPAKCDVIAVRAKLLA